MPIIKRAKHTILAALVASLGATSIATAVDPFTVAMLPDTQHYSDSATNIVNFTNQTQWIVDNRVAENIVMVSHVGDIVQVGSNTDHWDRADAAMDILDTVPDLPYGAALGNHDWQDGGGDATNYINYFGASRFAGRPWYGGASPNGRNQYHRFRAGGRDFMHLVLDNQGVSGPSTTTAWAQGVLQANPETPTIICIHNYLSPSGVHNSTIFNSLIKGNPQVFMVLSGHVEGEGHAIAQNSAGQDVFEIVHNFQSRINGGDGWMPLIEFDEDNDAINITTYSPTLDQNETDANSQYSFTMDFDARLGPVNTGPQMWAPSVSAITGSGATVQSQLINADATEVTLVWAHADQGESTVAAWTAASGGGSYSFGTTSKDAWLSRVLTGLDLDTPYSFRFLATAGADSDWSAAISFATDATSPSITSLTPSNGANDAAPNGTLVMNFDEDIRKGTGNIVIKASADHSIVQTIDIGSDDVVVSGSVVTVFLPADLAITTGYYVEIDSGAIEDFVSNPHTSFPWNFTTTIYTMVFSQDIYRSYSDPALGVGTISPFASIFGAIAPQDPNGTTGETTSLYDFRGLSATVPLAGETYFFLEDGHDGQVDVPGVTMTGGFVRTDDGRNGSTSSNGVDNVDEDDGAPDSSYGNPRGSMRLPSRFDFDVNVLGTLPNHVGIVFTERTTSTRTLNAYDGSDNLLVSAVLDPHGTDFPGDGFVGVITETGVAYITVSGDSEYDHLQYGYEPTIDASPPFITDLSPTNGSSGFGPTTSLAATFQEAVQKGTGNILIKALIGGGTIQIIDVTSSAVTISGTVVTIDPPSDLTAGTGYYVEIPSGAIEDSVGNVFSGFAGSSTWSFTTGVVDITAPNLATLQPSHTGTDVPVAANLVATFDEDVQKGTGNILIKALIGDATIQTIDVTSSSAVTVSGTVVTIDPPSNLAAGTGYYLEIPGGALLDLAGNPFAGFTGNSTWSFTTANAADLVQSNYNSYSNPAQGADTISPFSSIFGPITQQDPNPVSETTSIYDFRGLTAAPVAAGQLYFFLEDCQDGQFDVPGVTPTVSQIRTNDGRNGSTSSGGNADSIDEDDGLVDGLVGNPRGGLRFPTRFDFDIGVLNTLPNHVGIALAGDVPSVTINAYNSSDVLLDSATATAAVRAAFAGVATTEGIAYVTITGGTECDHFQYGYLPAGGGNDFSDWIEDPAFGLDTTDQGFDDDSDGDNLSNGLEAWFGTDPGQFNLGIANLTNDGIITTFTHPQNTSPPDDLTGYYEWSPNLVDWYVSGDGPSGGVIITFTSNTIGSTTTVTATASEDSDRLFLRARVTQN